MSKLKDLILKLATEFINIPADKFDEHINHTLALAGNFLNMDRAYLFEYNLKDRTMSNTHEWCAPGIASHINDLQDIPMDDYPEWVQSHMEGDPVLISDVEALPEGLLKSALTMQSIKSLITYPLLDEGTCLGFVGFDSVRRQRHWSSDDISLITMISEIYSNVLKKREMASRLQASERQYQELVEGLPIGLYRRAPGPGGGFIMVNSALAKIFGYERREDLLGLQISQFCADMDSMKQCAAELKATGMIKEKETRFKRRNGEIFWVSISAREVYDRNGNIRYVEGIVQDISERKRQEEEKERLKERLEQVQRIESIGRLAGGIAHDFNNLLVPILGYGELLMNALSNDEQLIRYVEPIIEAGERARDIVKQLLAFSSRQVIEKRPIQLNLLIEKFKKFLEHTLRDDIEIVLRLGQPLPIVEADGRQIEQVLLNLAVNAQEAMPSGGRLTIETASVDPCPKEGDAIPDMELSSFYVGDQGPLEGPCVLLSISDNGTGIDQNIRPHIFEPFFTTKEHDGTGLGLATVYGIVKQHGGVIRLDSSPEEGTTFRIYLPAAPGQVAETAEEGPEEFDLLRGSETILLVEDEDKVRELVSQTLRECGYRVISASAPQEAISMMENGGGPAIDMLVTDVIMPGMNGKELYDRLREMMPGLKVLYMSGYAPDDIPLDAESNFLTKPFSIRLLARSVRKILDTGFL